jgi:ABC-2 type transport system ATP-binding protein
VIGSIHNPAKRQDNPIRIVVTPPLVCRGVVKRWGKVVAVDGVDLEVERGSCFGLLGPNGAGKTTLVEILEGLTKPDAGTVEVLGNGWGGARDRETRQRIGVQLQETHLADKLTVEEIVTMFRSFYPRGRDPEEAIGLLGLEAKRQARYSTLSGGQKHRLALSCALVGDPEILFLDEPTTGLDPQARLAIWSVVEKFRQGGGTALITTHYMEEASRLCDKVAFMNGGKVVAAGTPAELVEKVPRGESKTGEPTLEDVFVRLTGRGLRDEWA